MTSSRETRHDDHGGKGHWSEDRGHNAFGPQGAALLGELRWMPGVVDREPDGEPRSSPAIRSQREGQREANPNSSKRAASSNRRKGIVRRAVRSWLAGLGFDDGVSDNCRGKPRAENVRSAAKSNLPMLHHDANVAQRAMARAGDGFGRNSTSNIHKLR